MANKTNGGSKKRANNYSSSASKQKRQPVKSSFFEKCEKHLEKRKGVYLTVCLLVALLLSLLSFNARITEAYDDSAYIEAGYNYAKNFFNYHYTATAPLYCMFLAIPIAIFGLNLVLLKMFSVIFFVLSIYLIYRAFEKRVDYLVLFPALFLTAVNHLLIYYASQTYTEAFVLMIAGLFLLVFFNVDDRTQQGMSIKDHWKQYLLLGFVMFVYYLSRNVAVAAVMVVVVYFLIYKKYWAALYSGISFAVFTFIYSKVITPLFWGHLGIASQFSNQSKLMFQKDVYNAGLGQEDFTGIIVRFFENAKIYFSQLFELLCLKSEASPKSYIYFIVMLLFVALSLYFAIVRKQKKIVATILYVVFFLGATFISLHTFWAQGRLILVYLPFIAIIVFYAVVELFKSKQLRSLQWVYLGLVVILILVNLNKSFVNAKNNLPILRKNITGDIYAGFTPDWVNYFKMSEWAAKNVDEEKVVACRKAPMSFIYSKGRTFFGITGVPSVVLDTVLQTSNFKNKFLGLPTNNLSVNFVNEIRPYINSIALGDNRIYYILDLPEQQFNRYAPALAQPGLSSYISPADMMTSLKAAHKSTYAIYPDSLLNNLRRSNVGYVIDASLRMDPRRKTEYTISTIRRYLFFIEQKYPGIFQKIHQIANDNNEPSMIYEIHYPESYSAKNE